MNIEKANDTALSKILKEFNYSELDKNNEKIIQAVCNYLEANNENHTRKDALRWINNMSGNTHYIADINVPENYEYGLLQHKTRFFPRPITKISLKSYLGKRGIPAMYAKDILQEIKVKCPYTATITRCVGLKNEKGGYDLRADHFKGMTKPEDIAFIRGEIPKPNNIHIFRNFIDYLTVLVMLRKSSLMGDSIILNSMKMLGAATPYIKYYGYKTLYSYMSNDKVGSDAIISLTNFSKYEEGLKHRPMNNIYLAFKDINQWHMRNLRIN